MTTDFTIRNDHSIATLTHLTLWTDLSRPLLTLEIYLPSGVTHTVSLRDLVCDGILPKTGFAVSPHPPGDPGVQFPSCNNTSTPGQAPVYLSPIAEVFITLIQEWLSGRMITVGSATGLCTSINHGDDLQRGYVTIDVVNDCSQAFPTESSYYGGTLGSGNHLVGEVRIVDPLSGYDMTFDAVHIEADPLGTVIGVGDPSFYSRYLPDGKSDHREPLPVDLTVAYDSRSEDPRFFIWRQGEGLGTGGFPCHELPSGFPLVDANVVVIPENPSDRTVLSHPVPYETNGLFFSELSLPLPIQTSTGTLRFRFESQSWILPGPIPHSEIATSFHTVTPCRAFDSRQAAQGPAIASEETRMINVAGTCGIPMTARSVSFNLTVVGPPGDGFVSLTLGNGSPMETSTINFSSGQTRATNGVLSLAHDGSGTLAARPFIAGSGAVHLILDVNGYFE